MKKLLILILLAVILSGCGGVPSGGGSDAKLIYAAIDDEGFNTGTLVVTDTNGKKMGEINLPEHQGRAYVRFIPTRSPGIVIAIQDSPDADRQTYWVNTGTGEVKLLDLADYPGVNSFFKSYSARFMVLEMGNPVEGIQARLIDLQTGALTNINVLFEGTEIRNGGIFSPDESHLLIRTDSGLWILPTVDPNALQLIADQGGLFYFSANGERVIYSPREDGVSYIKTYSIASKTSEIVYESPDNLLLSGIAPRNSDEIFVSKKGSINLLNIQTGEVKVIFEKPDFVPDKFIISSSGENVLAVNTFDKEYFLVDLDTLEAQSLEDLNGLEFWLYTLNLSAGTSQGWAYFVDGSVDTKVMKAVDFRNGKIIDTMSLKDDEPFRPFVFVTNFPSEDSTSFLVSGFNNKSEMVAWAINSDAELTVPLQGPEKAMFGLGGISQDGRWGVYSVNGSKDDKSVVVIDMKTGKTRTIAPGTSPVWLVD